MSTLQPLTIYRAASPIHSPEAVERAHSALLAALGAKFDLTVRPIDTLLTTPLANHHIILPGHI